MAAAGRSGWPSPLKRRQGHRQRCEPIPFPTPQQHRETATALHTCQVLLQPTAPLPPPVPDLCQRRPVFTRSHPGDESRCSGRHHGSGTATRQPRDDPGHSPTPSDTRMMVLFVPCPSLERNGAPRLERKGRARNASARPQPTATTHSRANCPRRPETGNPSRRKTQAGPEGQQPGHYRISAPGPA